MVDRLTQVRGASDPELLRAKSGLGGTLTALGSYREAHQLFQEAARVDGTDPQKGLQEQSNLAVSSVLLGEYARAAALHQSILHTRQRQLPESHPKTLISGLYYAWTLRLLGDYAEARSRQEHNHRLFKEGMGQWHASTLLAEHNLALCQRRAGDLEGRRDPCRVWWHAVCANVDRATPTHFTPRRTTPPSCANTAIWTRPANWPTRWPPVIAVSSVPITPSPSVRRAISAWSCGSTASVRKP